jgi:flavin-dependent dehydrogenase
MREILIAGGGPAGAAAAIAGRLEGVPVRLLERSVRARHKVCGEFISPGASEALKALGAWDRFQALEPRRILGCRLCLGNRTSQWKLPECAWGVSRLRLDEMLLARASELGAAVIRGETFVRQPESGAEERLIVACGRRYEAEPNDRLFGFKAHFEGPSTDAVELFFDGQGYVGVSGIEQGLTNVCGIARESLLRRYGFDFDAVARRPGPLAGRLGPLRRKMRWIAAGPLAFAPLTRLPSPAGIYPAGDALGFVDPFTGSGILNALITGRLSGIAAARGTASQTYLKECTALLGRAFLVSSVLRRAMGCKELRWLAPWLPGRILFRLTRAASYQP